MRYLTPLVLRENYYANIEKEIQRIFNLIMYEPLVKLLRENNKELDINNSINALIEAIRAGTIWHQDGMFRGEFNAKTSIELMKLGAKYNARTKSWWIPLGDVPTDLKMAQATADSRYTQLRDRLYNAINNMDAALIDKVTKTQSNYEKTLDSMEVDLQKTLPKAWKNPIIIEANLTVAQRDKIAKEWGNNLNLYIKGWTEENIKKLRQDIQPHILAGGRAAGLVKSIQDNYAVSTRKAKFLALQETKLLMSKFHETRYLDLGLDEYKWSTSHDSRVRHDHAELNGKIFSWKRPPVTNKQTGARNNPGCDWGCRCIAVPRLPK